MEKDKETLSVALQDVISLDKFKNLDLSEAKVLYALTTKELNNVDFSDYDDPASLKDSIYKSLYDMSYVMYGEDENDTLYVLSIEGQDFVDAVNARIDTIKNVKSGTDLFPESANITKHEPERIYKDIKSCILEEGDEEGGYLFEGKIVKDLESVRDGFWEIVEFFKYGIVLKHIIRNKLTEKKANKRLTFDELKKLYTDGDITIDGIDSKEVLNNCLKTIKKCINLIDSSEALSETKTEISTLKEDINKIKTSAKAKIDKEKENEEIAELLMTLNSDTWKELNILSGGQLYADLELQEKYKALLDKKIKESKMAYPLKMDIHDILEDENYHSLNQYLYLSNAFGEKERDEWVKFLEKQKLESKGNFLNLHVFFPEPMPEKLTKEVLSARLKVLKKMDEKNPSAVLKTRIKLINKMLANPDKFCTGGGINAGGEIKEDAGSRIQDKEGEEEVQDAYLRAQEALNEMAGVRETTAKNSLREVKHVNGGVIELAPAVVINMDNYKPYESISDLREKARVYLTSLRDEIFSLEESNPDIKFKISTPAIKHVTREAGYEKLIITKQLPEIFKQAIVLSVENDIKTQGIDHVLKCATFIMLKGKLYEYRFVLKMNKNSSVYLYDGTIDVQLPEIEKTA